MSPEMMEQAMAIAKKHLRYAHDRGQTNREILQAMDIEYSGEYPSDFRVCSEIAFWYMTSYYRATNETERLEKAA